MKKPLILMILDGFGCGKKGEEAANAILAAKTPNMDKLFAENPITQIGASGMDVGLPDGQMGNSEVGHTNIGAGRIVYQELTRITKTIREDKLKDNEEIVAAITTAQTFTCSVCSPPAAFTATTPTSTAYSSSARRRGLKTFTSTLFSTAETFPRQARRNMSPTQSRSVRR